MVRYPAISGKHQADAVRANMSPLRKLNVRFKAHCAETVLALMQADAKGQDFVDDRFFAGNFDRHDAGVDIQALAVDHASLHILAFDRKTVAITKLL
jgi:hypothetical protein